MFLTWLCSITPGDLLVALCTASSPLIAIRISKLLDEKKSTKNEQKTIFKTLMFTRAEPLDRRHVEALNSIDIVFSSKNKQESKIRSAWTAYLDILGDAPSQDEPEYVAKMDNWIKRKNAGFTKLMSRMSTYLKYDFDKTYIKNQSYQPKSYADFFSMQQYAQQVMIKILDGTTPLSVKIMPQNELTDDVQYKKNALK